MCYCLFLSTQVVITEDTGHIKVCTKNSFSEKLAEGVENWKGFICLFFKVVMVYQTNYREERMAQVLYETYASLEYTIHR